MSAPPLRRNRNFVLLQSGQLLSTLGNQTSVVAYPLLVLAVTHSPAKAGLVAFAGILPYPLFVLPAGLVADRWDRKRVMIVTDVVRALALGGLVAAIAGGDPAFALIFVVAFIDGTAFAFFNIAEVGALRAVVPKEQLPAAAAAEQARLSTVVLAGPPLGGFLFGLGRSLPFLLAALDDPDRDVALRAGESLVRLGRLPNAGGHARAAIDRTEAWPLETARVLDSLGAV